MWDRKRWDDENIFCVFLNFYRNRQLLWERPGELFPLKSGRGRKLNFSHTWPLQSRENNSPAWKAGKKEVMIIKQNRGYNQFFLNTDNRYVVFIIFLMEWESDGARITLTWSLPSANSWDYMQYLLMIVFFWKLSFPPASSTTQRIVSGILD